MVMFFASRGKVVYSDNSTHIIEAGNQEIDVATGISLYPGLYNVEVEYDMDTDALYSGFVYVKDDNVRARGLESVGGPLYKGKTKADCGFSYMDHTNSVRIVMQSYDVTYSVNSVRIVNTGKLWSVYAFIVSFVAALSVITCIFVDRAKRGLISKERVITIVVLATVFFITIFPMLYQDTKSTADDGYHKQRIEGVVAALEAFQFPVRLEPHWVQGYGYANGMFYCDLYLVFPAILRLLGFSVTASYNWYISAVCLATVLVSFYSYKRIFKKDKTALFLASLYSMSIMKVMKLISGGAIGEGTAVIFLPLILLGLYEIFYSDDNQYALRMSFVHLGIGSAGLVMCHILSTTITIATLSIFVLLNIIHIFKKKRILLLIMSGFTALILSMWFSIPFIEYYLLEDVHIKHVYARPIQFMGVFIPEIIPLFFNHYGNGGDVDKGMFRSNPQGIGFLLFAGIIVAIIICVFEFRKKNKVSRFFIHLIVLSILFFAFSLNCFPWNAIQSLGGPIKAFVSSIQFPARFLQWEVVFTVALMGFVVKYLEDNFSKNIVSICFSAGIILYSISFIFLQDGYMKNAVWYYIENAEGIGTGYISGGEYKPEGTDENICFYNRTDSSDNVLISEYLEGSLKGVMHVTNNSDDEGWAEYPLLNYRGYRAYDESGNKFSIVKGFNNVIRVIVPSGYEGNITVKFISPFYWRISEIISVIGVIAIILYIHRNHKKNIFFKEDEAFFTERKNDSEDGRNNGFVVAILGAFAFIMPSLPYMTGYIFEGTYINEVLAPFLQVENLTGIKAEVFYFGSLLTILIIAYMINRHVIRKVSMLEGNSKEDSQILSSISVLVYFVSPIMIYTLYNRVAIFDWIIMLLLPVVIGEIIILIRGLRENIAKPTATDVVILVLSLLITVSLFIISDPIVKDYDTLSNSLKIAKFFDMYPHKGEFNYMLYMAHPVQNHIAFLAMAIISIFVVIRNKNIELVQNKVTNSIDQKLITIIFAAVGIGLIASIPNVFSFLPKILLRVAGPLSLLSISNAILIFAIPVFKLFVEKYIHNSLYRYIIYLVLLLIILITSMYQLNDICYDSPALRYSYVSDNIY